MEFRTVARKLIAPLLAGTLLAGCAEMLPTGTARPGRTMRPSAVDVLAGGATVAGPLTLDGRPITLPGGRGGVIALATTNTPGRATLAVSSGGEAMPARAYGLASAGDTPPTHPEAALRRWEQRFRGIAPKPRYGLKAEPPLALGDRREFWVIASADERGVVERPVTARAIHVGTHCDVMVDVRAGSTLDAKARAMGEAFDATIFPTDVRVFGEPIAGGIDADGRVTLLVSPEVGDRGRSGTLGYFTVRDLFSPADAPEDEALARSNQRMMLYLSSEMVRAGGRADVQGTLAHELEHLINATRKLFGPADGHETEDVWLDEGLAMYAMQVNGFGLGSDAAVLTDHVAGFLAAPERYSLTQWEAGPGGSAYGMAYLFVTYLAERLGEPALKELVDARRIGVANVDAVARAHGTSMDRLFHDFVAAVLLDGVAGGADGKHRFERLELRGDVAGEKLRGPALTRLDRDATLGGRVLPYSVRYLLFSADAGQLTVQGSAVNQAGGWLVFR